VGRMYRVVSLIQGQRQLGQAQWGLELRGVCMCVCGEGPILVLGAIFDNLRGLSLRLVHRRLRSVPSIRYVPMLKS